MIIRNTTSGTIIISDLPGAQGGSGLSIPAGATLTVFDEDAEKSAQLSSLLTSGALIKAGDAEPNDATPVQDPSTTIRQWILSTDVGIIFGAGASPVHGFGAGNSYSGAHGTPVVLPLQIRNGSGVLDILNNASRVTVSIIGGTAAGATINGGTAPVVVSFVGGAASISVNAAGAGNVILGMSSPTHPSVILNVADTATVTMS